ncbi:MAG: porin family protein [Nitritalea sp.]
MAKAWSLWLILFLGIGGSEMLLAQTSVGFRAGFSTNSYSYRVQPASLTTRTDAGITAPTFALVAETFLAKNAGVQLEVQVLSLGFTERDTLENTNQTRFDYIRIPLLSNFYFGNKGRFHIKAGPYIGFLLDVVDVQREWSAPDILPTYAQEGDRVNAFTYGLAAGAGLSGLFGKSTLAAEVRASYEFARPELQNRIFDQNAVVIEVTLSYLFRVLKHRPLE